MNNNNIKVSIETPDGRAVRTYLHDGRYYIESHENMVYRIRVKNQTGNRIKAVIAVDSISIITGKPVSDKSDETGYILEPYVEELFRGYRVDANQVAEFKFVKREASYATEKGEGQGNGVIAVRAFTEKSNLDQKLKDLNEKFKEWQKRPVEKEYVPVYPPWYWDYPYYPKPRRPYYDTTFCQSWGASTKASNSTDGIVTSNTVYGSTEGCYTTKMDTGNVLRAASLVPEKEIDETTNIFQHGSGWGSPLEDKVKEVPFEVGELLAETVIYYAPLESLKTLGVNVTKEKQITFPKPFKTEYASPPVGWSSGKAR